MVMRCGGEVTGSDTPTASNLEHKCTHQVFCRLDNLQDTPERPIGAPLLGIRLPGAHISILGKNIEISATGFITIANE